jgi:hypothetical protein
MIQFNGQTILLPTDLIEEPLPIQTDLEAVDGTTSRQKMGSKWQATLTWENMDPVSYRQVMGIITTGSGFFYYNDQSAEVASALLTFSGMATYKPGSYVAGSSLNKTLTAVVREI